MLALVPVLSAKAQQFKDARREPQSYDIQLGSRSFTPRGRVATGLESRLARTIDQASPANKRAHILVQLQSPPEAEDRQRFAQRGITLLEPVNSTTWYASVASPTAGVFDRAGGVRWADTVRPEDKFARKARKGAAPQSYQQRAANRVAYSVTFHKDVTADEIAAFARQADIQLEDFEPDVYPVVRAVVVTTSSGGLDRLAAADIVAWIEPSPAPHIDHNVRKAQPLSKVNIVLAPPYNLDGSGISVGVWEAKGVVYDKNLDLAPRVKIQSDQRELTSDHSEHVAGTIGGSGVHVPDAKGMAPNVTIYSWDSQMDTIEMTRAARSGMIQISNHSYGTTIGWDGHNFHDNQDLFGKYNGQSANYDRVVSETKLIVVKSAGNDRNDRPPSPVPGQPADCFQESLGFASKCIGPGGVAKNVITVGAVDWSGDLEIKMSDFSSFGPTNDGRIKPDVVAQGVGMKSLGSGHFFSDKNHDGVDDVSDSDTASFLDSGTSMAAPVVTGIGALVLQQAKANNITVTPAAMKALLIQTARDVINVKVDGRVRAHPGPDYATGWGVVDAEAAIVLLRRSGITLGTLGASGRGNAWTRTFNVPAGQAELHITLAWDDEAGHPQNGKALVNDLDLRLKAPDGTEFTPWILDPRHPDQPARRNGGDDNVNNVEQVSVLTPAPGEWTAIVSAKPGSVLPQDFAVAGLAQP